MRQHMVKGVELPAVGVFALSSVCYFSISV